MFQNRSAPLERIFVSACLMGAQVRYDGRARTLDDPLLATWRAEGRLVVLCPEMAVGLPTPRPAAEIAAGATAEAVLAGRAGVYDRDCLDLTADFTQAADVALDVARAHGCRFALLADGSPSCGSSYVHAGNFDGRRIDGQGVVTARLRAAGIAVFAQHQLADLAYAVETAENAAR